MSPYKVQFSLLLLAIFCLQNHLVLSQDIGGLQTLLDWVIANGGSVSSKIEFRNVSDPDESLSFETTTTTPTPGVVAKEFIPKSETIMTIPQACVFRPDGDDGDDDVTCVTARALVNHYQHQDEDRQSSFYRPYLDFITKQELVLPHQWSNEAKNILNKIVGGELRSPLAAHSFAKDCDNGSETSEVKEHLFSWTLSKSWDGALIPLYDMVQHRVRAT